MSGTRGLFDSVLTTMFHAETLVGTNFFFFLFKMSHSFSSPFCLASSLSSHLIGHTGNGSDSFLRKLHPLPVCVPPHLPPCPFLFSKSFLRLLKDQPLGEWRSSNTARNPPVSANEVEAWWASQINHTAVQTQQAMAISCWVIFGCYPHSI